ncbi:hypothetical protein fHeYen901_69 [Yersinia phage fHe-Yen9-01]|uniref:Uncharacterized protein n=1 Tax=Yersinia phage fHe-Yen9-01 TaxID=1965363 RepID=A0A1V0DXG6_9CAUD|nr:hypothetical protein KNT60_gp068 [Yersinia phage fHe-Yen9-01]ARB05842.1 hypothetical protein fHeYen901_69 [Yersinia phage fHe-Yen9-01]
MLIQTKFKNLKVNAGFTLASPLGAICVKRDEKNYYDLSKPGFIPTIKKQIVWADSYMLKPWWKRLW